MHESLNQVMSHVILNAFHATLIQHMALKKLNYKMYYFKCFFKITFFLAALETELLKKCLNEMACKTYHLDFGPQNTF